MGTFFSGRRGAKYTGGIFLVVIVLALVSAGWWMRQKTPNDLEGLSEAQQQAITHAKCDYIDQDICKFIASWKATPSYAIEAITPSGNPKTTTLIRRQDNTRTHINVTGPTPYETIIINNNLYTKGGDTWYKQTISPESLHEHTGTIQVDFADPGAHNTPPFYTKLSTEKCSEGACFRYEIADPSNSNIKRYIWFDAKTYQLRRTQVITSEGGGYDATISYPPIEIKEPAPTQELAANEQIIPGQNTPTTLPRTGDGPATEEEFRQFMQHSQ